MRLVVVVFAFAYCIITTLALDDGNVKKPESTPRQGPVNGLKLKAFGIDFAEQTSIVVNAVPSTATLLIFNHALKMMRASLKLPTIPHALVGMFVVFFGLVSLSESDAAKIVAFMKPGVDLLTLFLPAFFIPALVVSPLSLSSISLADALKFFGSISVVMPFVYLCTGKMVELLQRLQGSSKNQETITKADAPAKFNPPFSAALETLYTVAVVASGTLASLQPSRPATHVFYVLTTMYSFVFGSRIPRYFSPAVARYCHPLLLAFGWSSAVLAAFAAANQRPLFPVLREYLVPGGPMAAAGNHVLFWLEPSIITFGFGLYSRRTLLFRNALPILGGAATSTVMGIFACAAVGRVAKAPDVVKLALLPRATAALAVVQAATIGANAPLTAVNCCFTGIFGANFGVSMLNALGIADPIARGVATGGGGLALASAALSTLDPAAFPFGALGMSLTSSMATIAFCVPQFTAAVKYVAGL